MSFVLFEPFCRYYYLDKRFITMTEVFIENSAESANVDYKCLKHMNIHNKGSLIWRQKCRSETMTAILNISSSFPIVIVEKVATNTGNAGNKKGDWWPCRIMQELDILRVKSHGAE